MLAQLIAIGLFGADTNPAPTPPRFSLVQLIALGAFDDGEVVVPPEPQPARFASEDYAAAALALMPRGPAWSDDGDSIQGRTLAALALSLWRNDSAAAALLKGAFPATADALMTEWETTVGLPDPITGIGSTDAQRRDQIVARLVGAGGQSRDRFIAFAANLGFTISIGNYTPLRIGHFNAGDAARSAAWLDVWSIHVSANTSGLPSTALKAEIDQIRPAETTTILV